MNDLTLDQYQLQTRATRNTEVDKQQLLANFALGLCGEAGEFGEIIKKHLFHGHELDVAKASKELGDVLWYASALADLIGVNLGTVAAENLAKLQARYPNGFSTEASKARVDVQK